jgi:hypothetical protein
VVVSKRVWKRGGISGSVQTKGFSGQKMACHIYVKVKRWTLPLGANIDAVSKMGAAGTESLRTGVSQGRRIGRGPFSDVSTQCSYFFNDRSVKKTWPLSNQLV